jgi:hypothetical protein
MDPKISINIEGGSIEDLCSKLYSELQRYNALRPFIEYSIRYMDESSLRDIGRRIHERRKELKGISLYSWDESSVEEYLRKLNPDAKKILYLIKQRGKITKSELMRATGFQPMKIAGVIAGMNNMAIKTMRRKPVIIRTDVRVEGRWEIEYSIEESFLKNMK